MRQQEEWAKEAQAKKAAQLQQQLESERKEALR